MLQSMLMYNTIHTIADEAIAEISIAGEIYLMYLTVMFFISKLYKSEKPIHASHAFQTGNKVKSTKFLI